MFFITTDTSLSLENLFSRIFQFIYPIEKKENTKIIKQPHLNAIFHNCREVELETYKVFISGKAFPEKTETLPSALKKTIQRGTGEGLLHGNFNLIVFHKNMEKNNSFSIIGDHHGTIPCFFNLENKVIRVSSILHMLLLDRSENFIDEQPLLDYLCLGYTLPGSSLWRSIEILPTHNVLTVFPDKKHLTMENKNQPQSLSPFDSLEEAASYFFDKLKEIMNDNINNLKPKYMLLTGGSDTRVLLSCMNEEQRKNLIHRTHETPVWSNTDNDLMVAKRIAKTLDLHHESYSSHPQAKEVEAITKTPQGHREIRYNIVDDRRLGYITGQFGSELFGGVFFDESLSLGYVFSKRLDSLKNALVGSLITPQRYNQIGSPWARLNQKVLSINSISKEGAFVPQRLLRSQFTSMYSLHNVNTFIIPSRHHFFHSITPYIDTRTIDFFLRCPREFLLNYNLYEYILTHFSEKKLSEIPFHSNMLKFVESLPGIEKNKDINIGAKSKCNYREYFENNFSPSLFQGTFLGEFSHKDSHKIHEPFLHKVCDLNSFLLGLQEANMIKA